MKGKIGFIKTDYLAKEKETKFDIGKMEIMARKSVVQVYFPDRCASYAYYNDQFDLKCGDIVFVEGKLEGLRGRVTDVNYNFKIKLSDYKRVISVADTNVKGEFYMAGSHLVTFDENALPKNKVVSWFKAPIKEEDEFVSGSDETTFSIDDLSGMNINKQIAERGHDYYVDNRVCYISIDGNQGYAIVEGSEAYEVEFEYHNREIRNLICSCYCSYNCKHEFAAMLQLRETLGLIEKKYEDTYKETGYFAAISKVMMFKMVVDGKEEGKLVYKGGVMKSKEIREYLIGLIEEYKNGIIDKDTVYDRAEALVSDNELEYSEDENLKCVLEHILPDACLLYIDEPGDEREKEKDFYESMCECENLLKYKS